MTGEAAGGWATVFALLVTIGTFVYTDHSQKEFEKEQIAAVNKGLELQEKATEQQRKAAEAQKETAAVQALGRYLAQPTDPMAWESAEAIIDVMGDDADQAWKATAKRALYAHPGNLQKIECELYSERFKDFVVSLTVSHSRDELCSKKAHFAVLRP